MSINVMWDTDPRFTPKTIIYWHFAAHWTWQDFMQANDESVTLAQSVPHTVHTIVDFTESRYFPHKGLLSGISRAIQRQAERRGYVVTVRTPNVILAFDRTVRKLHPQIEGRYLHAETVEEAYQTILHRGMSVN